MCQDVGHKTLQRQVVLTVHFWSSPRRRTAAIAPQLLNTIGSSVLVFDVILGRCVATSFNPAVGL